MTSTSSPDQAAAFAASTLLRAALDAMPDLAIVVLDTELRITAAHGGAIRHHGVVKPELVGRHAADVLPDSTWELAGPLFTRALGGESITVDLPSPNGRALFETTFEPILAGCAVAGVIARSHDVTRERRAEALVDRTFDSAPIGMATVALDGRFERVNDALCALFGRDRAALLATGFQELTHPDDRTAELELLRETLAGDRDGYELEKRYLAADGSTVESRVSMSLLRDEAGEPVHFISQVLDLTDRKTAERHLRYLADHDSLTGLLSRRHFELELQRAASAVRRGEPRAGLVLIDLDGFKAVNDALGHSAGDDILTRVGNALAHAVRHGDLVGRLGGDEFAVLLHDVDDASAATAAAKLVEAVRRDGVVERDGRSASVTASVGIAVLSEDGPRTPAEALSEADAALCAAKHAGKDQAR